MVNFELDEEQKMLVDAIGRFATDRMRKVYRDAEEETLVPQDLILAGWDFGLIPSGIPESYGGFGEYSALTNALAMETFVYGDLSIALNISTPGLVAVPVQMAGTEKQKAEYLPQFCSEKPPRLTAALTEPNIQFDPYNVETEAIREGDSYKLTGVKSMVPLADNADTILVYAAEEGQTQAFFVPSNTDGFEVGKREKLMGIHAIPTYSLTLTDCWIPVENRLGGQAGIEFGQILSHSRVALGAAAVGLAKACYDYAREYAKGRVQFDEPIAHRQSIAFMLAEMAIDVDAARLMVWEAAWKLDRGEDISREATVLKHFVEDMVIRIADQAVQTLGGYGYVREYPVELWLRNARGFTVFDNLAII